MCESPQTEILFWNLSAEPGLDVLFNGHLCLAWPVYGASFARLKELVKDPEILVDARGHRCPVPTLKLRRACEAAAPGSLLRLLADDPMARIDAPHFAVQAGFEVVRVEIVDSLVSVWIRKPPLPPDGGAKGVRRVVGGNDAPPG